MIKPAALCFFLALLVLCASGVATAPTQAQPQISSATLFAAAPSGQWRLPKRLREISGLALAPNGRLFGHGDNSAVVYQLDVGASSIVKSFSLGPAQPVRGDFEAIAIADTSDFYLITSTGVLYRFREGEDGAHVPFTTADTGLSQVCEIEGLAFDRAEDSLIIACKVSYQPHMRRHIALFAWSLRDHRTRPWRTFSAAPLAEAIGADTFHPSDITFDPLTHRMILLSGRERGLVELTPEGALIAGRSLAPLHRQPEAVAILSDGSLAIGDEAADAHALLTRYARVHD